MYAGGPVISDTPGTCHVCGGSYQPGDLVAIDEDLSMVHLEHSIWALVKN